MILNRQQLWTLWVGLGLFVAAFVWDACFSGEQNLMRYKKTIESHLHKIEDKVNASLTDKDFINHRLKNRFSDISKIDSFEATILPFT